MSLAIELFGVTARTRKRWLLGLSAIFMACGCYFGIAGFLEWQVQAGALAKLLG